MERRIRLRGAGQLVQPRVGTRLYGLPDFEANVPGFDGDGKSGGDHAGRVETSLLWALEPECVDVSRIPPVETAGPHFAMGANAREADRRIGERMVADEVGCPFKSENELLETPGGQRALAAWWARDDSARDDRERQRYEENALSELVSF